MFVVNLDRVLKKIKKLPAHIRDKLQNWVRDVELLGVAATRKRKGYHDELLKGKRKGQRSIRLSRSWRAIYREEKDGMINLIIVEEVSKHDY